MSDAMSRKSGNPKVYFHLDFGRDKGSSEIIRSPERGPYGFGNCVNFVEPSMSISKAERLALRTLRQVLIRLLGFDLTHAFRNRGRMKVAQVVVTHTEREYLAVAALIKLKLIPTVPLVGESIWLWDEWYGLFPIRRRFYRWLLTAVSVHLALSPQNSQIGSEALGERVHYLKYGADTHRRSVVPPSVPDPEGRIRVLAPGNDRDRDWDSLVEAAISDPRLHVTIASRRARARSAARRCPDRVTVVSNASDSEMRDLLQRHDVVAVPLQPNFHVSGITVMFEGLLSQRPVAISRTGGLEDYAEGLVEWAEPKSALSLCEAIHRAHAIVTETELLEQRRASLVDQGLTIADFGGRHVVAIWIALGRPVETGLMSAVGPVMEKLNVLNSGEQTV